MSQLRDFTDLKLCVCHMLLIDYVVCIADASAGSLALGWNQAMCVTNDYNVCL